MKDIPAAAVPRILAALRRSKGWSVSELARRMGLEGDNAADTIRKIERGAKPASGTFRRLLAYVIDDTA